MSQTELQARLAELDSERSEILKQLGQEDVVEAAKNALATAAAAGAATAATKVVEKAVEEEEDDIKPPKPVAKLLPKLFFPIYEFPIN